jgi:hypothetical protein
MAALLEQQRQRFDIILIDSPPLLPVTDAAVVATHADGAVVVTRGGQDVTGAGRRRPGQPAGRRRPDLGGVLNMAPSRGRSEYYSYAYAPRNPRTTSLPVSVQRINGAAHRASDARWTPARPARTRTSRRSGSRDESDGRFERRLDPLGTRRHVGQRAQHRVGEVVLVGRAGWNPARTVGHCVEQALIPRVRSGSTG